MVSLALILMTLPSRVAEVRAGRADRARHLESWPDARTNADRQSRLSSEAVVAASAWTTLVLPPGTTPVRLGPNATTKER